MLIVIQTRSYDIFLICCSKNKKQKQKEICVLSDVFVYIQLPISHVWSMRLWTPYKGSHFKTALPKKSNIYSSSPTLRTYPVTNPPITRQLFNKKVYSTIKSDKATNNFSNLQRKELSISSSRTERRIHFLIHTHFSID